MANYLDGAVTVYMPLAAGTINAVMGAVTIDMPTADGVIAASIPYLNGAVTFDMPEVDGSIVMPPYLNGAVTVDMPVAAGTFMSITLLSGAVTVDAPIADGTFLSALTGAVTVDMPTVAGIIAGSIPILDGAVTVDMPTAAGTFGFVTPSTFSCLVQNLKNSGVSTYTGYSYNSACYFNGVYLGVTGAGTGIHKLSGSTNNGTAIASSVTLGSSDFGASQHKNIPNVLLDFSGPSAMTVTMAIDSNAEGTARSITAPASGLIETRRGRLPLGNIGRHWQPKFANVAGADFELQSIELQVDVLARKI